MKIEITISPELYGAMVSKFDDSRKDSFAKDPMQFLTNELGVELDNVVIKTVSNDSQNVNLALPYYEAIDVMAKPAIIGDEQLEEISGGSSIIEIAIADQAAADFLNGRSAAAKTTNKVYRRLSDDHYGSAKSSFTSAPVASNPAPSSPAPASPASSIDK